MPNTTANQTTITNSVTSSGTALLLHCNAANYGVGLEATGTAYGIYGHTSPPVSGSTTAYAGVFGSTNGSGAAGVVGTATGGGAYGVTGSCEAASGFGVHGSSAHGTGVRGLIESISGANNTV